MPLNSHITGVDNNVQNNIYQRQGGNELVLRGQKGILSSENALWGNCPLSAQMLDPSIAVFLDEDFVSFNKAATDGDYVGTAATAGSAAISTTVPGALKLNAGSSTAHQGYQVQRVKSAFVPAANKDLWFEAQILLGTALTIEAFVGLADSDTTLISSGSLHPTDCIGFSSVTGDGVMLFNCNNASTDNTPAASPITLSITVPHKLGFFYDSVLNTVQAFVDGVAVGAAIASTYIPTVVIYPSFCCQSTGVSQPTMTIMGYRVFQLR